MIEQPAVPERPTSHAGAVSTVTIDTPDVMHDFGVRLGRKLSAGDLVILTGPLGAGKTTLSRGVGEGLQVRGPVTSPTFVLARTHPSLVSGPPLVHLDAYRLADAGELDDLDLDYEGSVVLAEWGAGLVETRESWIEIVIERPTGASVVNESAAGGDGGDGRDGGDEDEDIDVEDVGAEDVDAEEVEELIEPRIVTITGYGSRWLHGVI